MTEFQVRTAGGDVACDCATDETLLHALQRHGIHLPAPCGGIGKCGKCRVEVSDEDAAGPRKIEEDLHAPEGSGTRLACRCVPRSPLTVTLPGSIEWAAEDTEAKGGAIEVPTSGFPAVRSVPLLLEPPTLEDQRSVHRRLMDQIGDAASSVSLSAVRDAAVLMKDLSEPRMVAGLVLTTRSGDLLAGVDESIREVLPVVAVDIGTTTIAAYLIDAASRRVLAVRSEQNQQGRFGADVISRIAATSAGNDLTSVVRTQLSEMIESLALSAGIDTGSVMAASVVGNPTMIHLLLGLDTEPIGRSPFMPLTSEGLEVPMVAFGLPGHGEATLTTAPGLSAYVGADIVADLLASELTAGDGLSLLIDIGTNGELVLGNSQYIIACSTAAGPAFEGANIRCGSGGVPGAIDTVRRDGDRLVHTTIGDVPAKSICGPGLIDLIALLLDDSVADETGRLDTGVAGDLAAYRDRVTEVDGEPALTLSDADSSTEIVLTQGDVRQVQLAKGAIAAGVRTLLDEANVTVDDIATVYLAGGFGTYLNPRSATRIGILPDIPPTVVKAIGNAAGSGAVRLLLDLDARAEARRIALEGKYLELSRSTRFQQYFTDEMMFG